MELHGNASASTSRSKYSVVPKRKKKDHLSRKHNILALHSHEPEAKSNHLQWTILITTWKYYRGAASFSLAPSAPATLQAGRGLKSDQKRTEANGRGRRVAVPPSVKPNNIWSAISAVQRRSRCCAVQGCCASGGGKRLAGDLGSYAQKFYIIQVYLYFCTIFIKFFGYHLS
jgi:hypothetical protein